jgi:DNA-binding NarL/FixJ family response regulator
MNKVTIVLADDHQLVRDGLRVLLNMEPDLTVVGEADEGLQAADLVERLQPDVLLVDIVMPGLNGVEVTRQVNRRSPKTKILVLSMYTNEAYILAALRNGAAGYVLKSASADILIEAIHTVINGNRYLCPPLTERAIEAYIQKSESGALNIHDTLTLREHEVLHLAAEGLSNPQIAGRLGISPRTVESHREKIMQKLCLHSHTDLIRYALKHGIISMDE